MHKTAKVSLRKASVQKKADRVAILGGKLKKKIPRLRTLSVNVALHLQSRSKVDKVLTCYLNVNIGVWLRL